MGIVFDTRTERLIGQLHNVEGKAEIVGGRIERLPENSCLHGSAAGAILGSLKTQEKSLGGRAFSSTIAFLINLPHRKSISPDVSFYIGRRWGMKFPEGSPRFAVEIREDDEYGQLFEGSIAAKRADYFAAGTKVMWDVDLLGDDVVRVYRASAPDAPTNYGRGQLAEAEPAVPGWTMPVDELFE